MSFNAWCISGTEGLVYVATGFMFEQFSNVSFLHNTQKVRHKLKPWEQGYPIATFPALATCWSLEWTGEMAPQQLIVALDHMESLNSCGKTHVQWFWLQRIWPSLAQTLYTHTVHTHTHIWQHHEHGNHILNLLTVFSISVPGFFIKPGYTNDAGKPWADHHDPDALTCPFLRLSPNTQSYSCHSPHFCFTVFLRQCTLQLAPIDTGWWDLELRFGGFGVQERALSKRIIVSSFFPCGQI